MRHLVKLSNGRVVALTEEDDLLSIALMDGDDGDGDVDGYICDISSNGVLTYPNSGSATDYLTSGLREND